MKAVIIEKFGNPDVFHLDEMPELSIAEDEVLIEAVAGSVNPVDWKQRQGNHRFIFGSAFPIVLGYDVSGIVRKKGSKIQRFEIGDRVCGVLNNKYGGGLSQFVKGKEKCFTRVPDSVDLSLTAALPLAGLTSLQALRDKGKIVSGYKVLIIGAAGGVGHFAQQIASIYQAKIYSVSSASHKEFLRKLSDHTFLDYKSTNILKLSEKFDIILDAVGKYSFLSCRHLLNSGGIYINTLPRPKIVFHKLVALFTHGKKVRTLLMKQNSNDLEKLMNWVSEGRLNIFIDTEFPVNQMNKAHEYSEAGHAEGKILIRYNWPS
jgi:NADPH:quinone reductase-like Zn-dependent oxidoreductase